MPGFGLFQEPAVTQLPEIVHHRGFGRMGVLVGDIVVQQEHHETIAANSK